MFINNFFLQRLPYISVAAEATANYNFGIQPWLPTLLMKSAEWCWLTWQTCLAIYYAKTANRKTQICNGKKYSVHWIQQLQQIVSTYNVWCVQETCPDNEWYLFATIVISRWQILARTPSTTLLWHFIYDLRCNSRHSGDNSKQYCLVDRDHGALWLFVLSCAL